MKQIQMYNDDCLNVIRTIKDNSIDVILTDPPYKYLKNQKLEVDFDENVFFSEVKRVLKPTGFIVLFGRGTSFYRWNTMLSDLDFQFKEEIIWSKGYCSSPLLSMSRVHETISIHTLKGKINKVKVPYLEMKRHNIDGVIQDVKRLSSALRNPKSMIALNDFLENNKHAIMDVRKKPISTTISSPILGANRSASVLSAMEEGMNEKTIIRTDRVDCCTISKYGTGMQNKPKTGDRGVNAIQAMEFGLNEKSIINASRDHFTAIHPTQKPVRLLERLLELTIPKDSMKDDIVVADFFGGSFSTMEAVIGIGVRGITCEIDKEYFLDGKKRIDALLAE